MIIKAGGTDWDTLNVVVTTATDVEITYNRPVKSFFLKPRDPNATIYYRRTDNGTNYVSFLPGQVIQSELLLGDASWASASLGFIRCDVDTVIEGLVTFS